MTQTTRQPYHALAAYYEQLSETRDWDGWIAYVDAVLQSAPGQQPRKILDAACGTGRIAVGLASLGYDVTGVDASPSMLQQAQRNSEQFGLKVSLHHQDLRQLRLGTRFQAAISLCDSLNYITEAQEFTQTLHNISLHLEPGGFFLFDVNTEWKLQTMYGDHTYAEHRDGFSYIWENTYDPQRKKVTMQLAFFVESEGGAYRRYDEVHVQRAYSHLEVVQSLAQAGLELIGWGDPYGLVPPESRKERVFYLAQKPFEHAK